MSNVEKYYIDYKKKSIHLVNKMQYLQGFCAN
jgi:hypothetical protein